MKLNFDYKDKKITYNLVYKKTRVISISVRENKVVDVVAPIGTSVYAIMDKVKGNAEWIIGEVYGKNTDMLSEQIDRNQAELFEQYTYLGKNYKLQLVLNADCENITVKMLRGKLVVETSNESPTEIRKAIIAWYENKVSAKIKERMKSFKDEYNTTPNEISIVYNQDTFIKMDDVSVSVDVSMGMAPVEVIDYVIISELNKINRLSKEVSDEKMERLGLQVDRLGKWIEDNKNELIL